MSTPVGLHMWGYRCGPVGFPIYGAVGLWASPYPHAWACVPPHLWASPPVCLWLPTCPHLPICGDGGFHPTVCARFSALSRFPLVGLWASPPVVIPICGPVGIPTSPLVRLWFSPPVVMCTSPYPHPHTPTGPHLQKISHPLHTIAHVIGVVAGQSFYKHAASTP